jgi:hypothetical protein
MASRTLRSRTVEPSQRDDVATSQEGEYDWPHDQPEGLDSEPQSSSAEASQAIDSEAQVTETTKTTTGNVYSKEVNVGDMSEFKTMIISLFATLENKIETTLENKLESANKESKEGLKILQNKLETSHGDLKESNDRFQKEPSLKNYKEI